MLQDTTDQPHSSASACQRLSCPPSRSIATMWSEVALLHTVALQKICYYFNKI